MNALMVVLAAGLGSYALRMSMIAAAPLAAVVVGVLAVLRTGSGYAAVLAGMPTLWLLTAITSA